ncbi:MAG: hypothetical protein KKI08_03145 [Armatimonadetes bacterium]|nr:hypothetical protein [Armatimonadota bacterium]
MPTPIGLKTEDGRTYLEGVSPMDWGTGEMCEFAAALTRTLDCVGEDVPYHTIMGVTGVAFRFTMGPGLWNPGFYGFAGVAADVHDLFRRAFAAVGREHHWFAQGDRSEDLQRFTDSIGRGVTVMVRGHLVDASDWVIITGYEQGGDVLLGSSPYGGGERIQGYDVIPGWHEKVESYIILGEKCERPPTEAIYIEALQLAVELVRGPEIGEHYAGLKAYEVLAAALREEAFAEAAEREEDTPWFRYLCLLCYNMMLDDHASAPPFLRDAAGALSASSAPLFAAAECYDRSFALRNELESTLPSSFSPEAQKRVLDPAPREQFAQTILQIRDVEEEGITHVEQALGQLERGARS